MGSPSRSLYVTAIIIGLALEATCAGKTGSSEHKEYKSRYYVTTIDKNTNNGKCTQEIAIKGNGVHDTFTEPCVENLGVMNTDELLIIGNPKKDPYSLICFSDTASVVVVIKDDKCTMQMYSEQDTLNNEQQSKDVPPNKLGMTMTLKEDVCVDLQGKVNKLMQKSNGAKSSKDGEDGEDGNDDPEPQIGDEGKLVSRYKVLVTSSTKKEKCIQEIRIKGNGVEDVFKGPCVNDLEIVNTKDIMIVGNPEKNPFTVFSDRMKTLIIIKDGQCKEKYYKTANGLTKSSSKEVDDEECEEVKKKIKKAFGKKISDKDDGKLSSKFVVSTDTSERRGKCSQEIKIEGNGVEELFRGPCVDDLKVINEEDVLVVGDPDKNPFTLFSDKRNSLVIFKDGLCKERSYKTINGKTTSSSTELDGDKCDEIEEKIKKELKKKRKTDEDDNQEESTFDVTTDTFERIGKCIQNIKITGNGIKDTFRRPCVKDLEIIKKKNLLVVGDPDKDPFSFFSAEANTLAIVKDSFCKKKIYKTVNGKTTSSSTDLDDLECEEVENEISKELEKKRKEGDSEENSKYTVTSDIFERRGKCIQNIKIKGNGIEDNFRGPCIDDLEIIKKEVLLVGDPAKNPFSLFSNKANSLVIVKDGTCKERTYTTVKGKITSSSRVLEDEKCEEVEDTIEEELQKNRKANKGGSVKRPKYVVTTDTTERRGKCIQEINIEGNGVKDSFKGPCAEDLKILNKQNFLIVGYPASNPFSMYSVKPNSLIIVKDGICKERTYKTVDGKTTSSSEVLEDEECENIEDIIEETMFKN